MRGFVIAAGLLLVGGCASAPLPQAVLSPAERPVPLLAETGEGVPKDLATERIVVDAKTFGDVGLESVAHALGRFVAPGTWGPEHGTALFADGDAIVVRHSPGIREQLRSAVRALEGAAGRMLTVNARYIEMPPEVLVELESAAAAEGGVADVYAGDELRAVVAGWMKNKTVHVLTAPRLTLFAAQPGSITVADQKAYISGYEKHAAGGAVTWDPVIGAVNAGLALDVAAIPNGPGSNDVLIRFSLEMTELFEEAGGFLVLRQGGGVATRHTELPRVSGSRLAATLALRPGQAILAVVPEPPVAGAEAKLLAVILEVEWVK